MKLQLLQDLKKNAPPHPIPFNKDNTIRDNTNENQVSLKVEIKNQMG